MKGKIRGGIVSNQGRCNFVYCYALFKTDSAGWSAAKQHEIEYKKFLSGIQYLKTVQEPVCKIISILSVEDKSFMLFYVFVKML